MRSSKIRDKLAQDAPVLITSLHLCSPAVFEMASLMGFDGLWVDMEHHAHSLETIQNMMRAARVGQSDVVVRPAKGEFMQIGRMLEAGAQGIMYPRCDDADEAAEVVKWAKFPPLGKRGCDGGNADVPYMSMPMDQYMKLANEHTFLIIQLEEQHAIDNADKIAAVEGVDVLMLGPGDYASLSGFPGQTDHPRLADAHTKIARAARRAGKHWGRPAASPEQARQFAEMGARFFTHGSDLSAIKRGFEQIQAKFEGQGFSFFNQLKGNAAHRRSTPHHDGANLAALLQGRPNLIDIAPAG